MSPNWNPRTIFMDVREVSIVIANGAAPKPDPRGGNRLLCAIKMRLGRWMSCGPTRSKQLNDIGQHLQSLKFHASRTR